MEISHFLRARPKTTALALLFPVVAALVALLVLVNQPPRYTSTATVSVPGSAAGSASRVGLFVADFAELATSGAVLGEVADSTGQSRPELAEGLTVSRIGQSSLFTVAYTSADQSVTDPVVRAVVTVTFGDLVAVSDAEEELAAATDVYNTASAERTAYQDEIGTLQPDRDYADLSSRIRSLEISPDAGSGLTLARLNSQRDALVPQIRRMQELDQAVQDAADQKDQATQAVASAQREAAAAQSSSTIQDVVQTQESRASRIVQGVGVAAVAGLLVGLAFLMLPDLLRRRTVSAPDRPGSESGRSMSGAHSAG